jgi:hypothetical protein
VFVTEKIDGCNARVILLYEQYTWLIGSREELLHHRGDLLYNKSQGIVQALHILPQRLLDSRFAPVWVAYGEVYGGKTTAGAPNYTDGDTTKVGFRVFDVAAWHDPHALFELSALDPSQIAGWRETVGLPWVQGPIPLELRVPEIVATRPPRSLSDTYAWLKEALPGSTHAALPGAVGGRPEGVVVRSADRTRIAKIRFQDYERSSRT